MATSQDEPSVSSSGSCAQARSEHTPGPWSVENARIVAEGSKSWKRIDHIANVYAYNGDQLQEAKANAQLIAAAPDLLSAAKRMLDAIQSNDPAEPGAQAPNGGAVMSLKGAIAKAEGEA